MDIPTPAPHGPPSAPAPSSRAPRPGRYKLIAAIAVGTVVIVAIALVVLALVLHFDLGLVALIAVAAVLGLTTVVTPLLPQGLPGLAMARRITGGLLWLVVVAIAYLYVYPQMRG